MKKLVSLLLCLMLFLPAAALAEEGWFARAEMSDEEYELLILMMMDEKYGPYAFKAPDGAKYLTLTLWEMQDGQWTNRCDLVRALTSVPRDTELTIVASQAEDGSWKAQVQQNAAMPDGRIYINAAEAPNSIALTIQQPKTAPDRYDNFDAVCSWLDEQVNTYGMSCYQRTFLQPEKDGLYQQQVSAALNEQVVLELYVCFFEGRHALPAISEFSAPAVFAEFDHAYALTATFSAQPLPEAE